MRMAREGTKDQKKTGSSPSKGGKKKAPGVAYAGGRGLQKRRGVEVEKGGDARSRCGRRQTREEEGPGDKWEELRKGGTIVETMTSKRRGDPLGRTPICPGKRGSWGTLTPFRLPRRPISLHEGVTRAPGDARCKKQNDCRKRRKPEEKRRRCVGDPDVLPKMRMGPRGKTLGGEARFSTGSKRRIPALGEEN